MPFNLLNKKQFKKQIEILDNYYLSELQRLDIEKQDILRTITNIKNDLKQQFNAIQKQRKQKKIPKRVVRKKA